MNAHVQLPVTRLGSPPSLDAVAEEVPIAFEYNGISHTVMLATPADLEDFALGFSITEGIVAKRSEVFDIEIEESEAGITVHLEIAGGAFARLKEHRRSLAGRTGCGLCGAESLTQVVRELAAGCGGMPFPLAALYEGMHRLPAQQLLQQATGAVHAACCIAADGSIRHVREDWAAITHWTRRWARWFVPMPVQSPVERRYRLARFSSPAAPVSRWCKNPPRWATVSSPLFGADCCRRALGRQAQCHAGWLSARQQLRHLYSRPSPARNHEMKPDKLIKMANQIGAFFEAMPDREQAVKDVAAHIQRSWEPRMRTALHNHVTLNGDEALSPIVRDALRIVQKVG